MSSKPWKYLRKIETIFTKKIRQLINKGPRWTRFAIKRFRKSHDTVPLKEKNNTKKFLSDPFLLDRRSNLRLRFCLKTVAYGV